MIFISYLIVVMADKMMSESACTRRGDFTLTLAAMQTTNFLTHVFPNNALRQSAVY